MLKLCIVNELEYNEMVHLFKHYNQSGCRSVLGFEYIFE